MDIYEKHSIIVLLIVLIALTGCSAVLPAWETADKSTTITTISLDVYAVTNRSQLPTDNPQAIGLWHRSFGIIDWGAGQFGEQEQIWVVCVEKDGKLYIDPYLLGHELLHALHYRNAIFPNPDEDVPIILSTPSRRIQSLKY